MKQLAKAWRWFIGKKALQFRIKYMTYFQHWDRMELQLEAVAGGTTAKVTLQYSGNLSVGDVLQFSTDYPPCWTRLWRWLSKKLVRA